MPSSGLKLRFLMRGIRAGVSERGLLKTQIIFPETLTTKLNRKPFTTKTGQEWVLCTNFLPCYLYPDSMILLNNHTN